MVYVQERQAQRKLLLTRANSLESPPPWALAMVSTAGPLTVDGTGQEVWLQVVVMSRGRRWPCNLGGMDGRWVLQRDQGPGVKIRATIGDGGTLIARA